MVMPTWSHNRATDCVHQVRMKLQEVSLCRKKLLSGIFMRIFQWWCMLGSGGPWNTIYINDQFKSFLTVLLARLSPTLSTAAAKLSSSCLCFSPVQWYSNNLAYWLHTLCIHTHAHMCLQTRAQTNSDFSIWIAILLIFKQIFRIFFTL